MIKWTPRIIFLFVTLFWGVFALLSGAEAYGNGFMAVLKNSPNALPWLGLLIINWIAWKYPKTGGILVLAVAVFLSFFFNMWSSRGVFLLALVFLPLVITGVLFLMQKRTTDLTS